MEGNDTETASWVQKFNHGINGLFQHIQFMVALNPYGLEGALGRMSARGPYPGRDGGLDNLRQLSCCLNGMFPSCPYNVLCYVLGKIVLTIIPDDPVQLHLSIGIDNVCRRGSIPLVHPHIKGRVLPVGESPGCSVQLIGGNPQIQVNPIHLHKPQSIQHCPDILIIASYNGNLILKMLQPPAGRLYGIRVLVNPYEPAAPQTLAYLIGMSASAQRAVHIDSSGLYIQAAHCFIQKYGLVYK